MIVEQLDWDSEFFGIAIGRAQTDDVDAVLIEARRQGLECVYFETEATLAAPPSAELVLADERVRLIQDRPGSSRAINAVAIREGDAVDLPLLNRAVEGLVPWSRFARDPHFGYSAARRLYWRWIERAHEDSAEALAVASCDGSIAGFVTVTTGPPPEIGLIASTVPGAGVATALLRWVSAEFAGAAPLEVVTQAGNGRALALYEREGFREARRTHAYHLWVHENNDG